MVDTCKISNGDVVVAEYAGSPRFVSSVMTIPQEVVRQVAQQLFGHEVSSCGTSTHSRTEQVGPKSFRTVNKVTFTEGIQTGPFGWSYVNTRSVTLDWECVSVY